MPFTQLLMLVWEPIHSHVIGSLLESVPVFAAILPFPNTCAWRAACPTCSGELMKNEPSSKYLALKQAFNDLLVEEATSDSPGRLRRMSRLLKLGQDLERTYGRDTVKDLADVDEEDGEEDGIGIYRPRIAGRYGGDVADMQRQMMMLAQRALEAWVAKQTGAPLGPAALGPEDFAKVLNAAATADRDNNPPGPAPEHDAADAAAE